MIAENMNPEDLDIIETLLGFRAADSIKIGN